MTTSFVWRQPIRSSKAKTATSSRRLKDGDTTHEQAREDMKNRWKHPKQSMDWYSGIKKEFAELPED